MQALRRIIGGALLVAVAAGFSLVPAAPAAAETSAAALEASCPYEPGWYAIFDGMTDELVLVIYIDPNCDIFLWEM